MKKICLFAKLLTKNIITLNLGQGEKNMAEGTFATAINCMDGRTQEPVNNWMKKEFKVNYVDSVTEPGPDKILAEGSSSLVESIKNRVLISVEKHGSKNIVLVSHHDCAGNPVSKEKHLKQLEESLNLISSWNLDVNVFGVWVDENWNVNKII